jgi:hypothetical protein
MVAMFFSMPGVDCGDWTGTVKCVCRYPLTKSGRVVEALAHRSMREGEKRASQKIRYRYDARASWLSRDCLGLDWVMIASE